MAINLKAHFRGKNIQEDWTLICPNHRDVHSTMRLETVATYDLFDKKGKSLGIGCYKCYGKLPVKKNGKP